MFEQRGGSISWPFLTVLVFWICMLFLGFGLFARFNVTVTVALLAGALSVAGAIFLILELNHPYQGLMQISDEPLRNAMAQIDR
jgi:nitric oxide reductase large subunit